MVNGKYKEDDATIWIISFVPIDEDLFIMVDDGADDMKIAKRADTPGQWISLEPGWTVTGDEYSTMIEHDGHSVELPRGG